MKTHTLNLLLVDDKKLIVSSLSKYLNDRFGMRINISSFFDEESCMLQIDDRSHVIILDYFLNSDSEKTKNGLEIFNSIKKRSPKTNVTMITSNEDIEDAIKEMQRGTSDYIINRERYLQKILLLLNQAVLYPIKKTIVAPIRKIITEYTLQDYITTFILVFIAAGILVFLGLKIFQNY
jgi:DNA-binding NtrC family response regulator